MRVLRALRWVATVTGLPYSAAYFAVSFGWVDWSLPKPTYADVGLLLLAGVFLLWSSHTERVRSQSEGAVDE